MKLNDFNAKLTAKALNESAFKQFGQNLDLENFTLEQLYDARNKLRTTVAQYESSSNYNEVFENDVYHKNRLFLDILNREIEERADIMHVTDKEDAVLNLVAEGKVHVSDLPMELQEKAKSKAQQKFMGMVYAAKKGEKPASKEVKKVAKGISKKDAKDFAKTKHKGLPKKIKESILREGEEEKAALIMATRDMVDRLTGWMEDCASMQSEQMLDLTDSIRYELGSKLASQFENTIKPALADIYDALDRNRKILTVGVSMLTGEEHAMMGEEPPVEGEEGDESITLGPQGDEFEVSEPAAGGEEPAGRATRESKEYTPAKK